MALKRLSEGVYRNEQGKVVYSKDGRTATATPGGTPAAGGQSAEDTAAYNAGKAAGPGTMAPPQYRGSARTAYQKGQAAATRPPGVTGPTPTPTGPQAVEALPTVTGNELSQTATDLAGNQLNNAGLENTYQLPTDNRTIGADSATTSRLADEAFARVNKDITRREADERSSLQSELANRGININNPEDPTYKRFMQDLERKFTNERDQAQSSAQAGATQTQVALGGLQETIRTNVVGESAGERNQRLAEIERLSALAEQAKNNGFKSRELELRKQIAELQARASNRGGAAPAPASPFNNTTAPTTGR